MKVFSQVIGNMHSNEWIEALRSVQIETITLDQWTAQKSRLVAKSDRGTEYAISLGRGQRLSDGDILEYDHEAHRAVVVDVMMHEVMVIRLDRLLRFTPEFIARTAFELGHAIGNQHWPAVVKGSQVYVPLTTDRKVMQSVMRTHRIEHIDIDFRRGAEVIPYLAPHEVRRLFGGTDPAVVEQAHSHSHQHTQSYEHSHLHTHKSTK